MKSDTFTVEVPPQSGIRTPRRGLRIVIVFGSIVSMLFLASIIYLYIWTNSLSKAINKIVTIDVVTDSAFSGSTEAVTKQPTCFNIPDLEKFDCYPDGPATQQQCEIRGCCFENSSETTNYENHVSLGSLGIPSCFYPSDYVGYEIKQVRETKDGYNAVLERVVPSGFPIDIKNLNVAVEYIDENIIRIKITDLDSRRFEAPLIKEVTKKVFKGPKKYDVLLLSNGTLSVLRQSTRIAVFNTNLHRLVYSNQFLQISTTLNTRFVYGLGEHYDRLLRNVSWTRTPLFNRDNWPRPIVNLYGTHPFYIGLEEGTNSHGVFLLNSNSIDVILQPTSAATFRPIGGILDLFVFLGPSPAEVVQQYTHIVQRTFMPPYWSLGFHLCKYGYGSLNETKAVWKRTREAGIPFDVQWNDIDYMDSYNDFTYDKVNYSGLPEFVNELHNVGMHYVMINDAGISNTETPGTYPPYDDGLKEDIFIKDNKGNIFVGKVWNPISTVFPDFSNPRIEAYWTKQYKDFHDVISFDGSWIDMNEPANFYNGTKHGCPNTALDNPHYVPGGLEPLEVHTLCMSAKHYNTTHYNEHTLHAFREAKATYFAMANITQKRPFVISRASSPGLGFYSGHWSGDIGSNWEDLRYSLYDMLNFNIFGISMMGSDICGFRDNTTVELCARWQTLGAFYPFSRNHNDLNQKPQDPVALGPIVVEAARNTLITRYNLLPYLYTLFYESHVFGKTVARPLFFEFIDDPQTYTIDEQFLWGSALMIMPAVYEGIREITVYFPKAIWYDFYTGKKQRFYGKTATLAAPIESINLAFRGGFVIPQQHYATTTTKSRLNKFFLLAGLDENNSAVGELYWDDGESIGSYEKGEYNLIKFSISNNVLTSVVSHAGYATNMELDSIKICGLKESPSHVTLDGKNISHKFDYECLIVSADANLSQEFKLSWS